MEADSMELALLGLDIDTSSAVKGSLIMLLDTLHGYLARNLLCGKHLLNLTDAQTVTAVVKALSQADINVTGPALSATEIDKATAEELKPFISSDSITYDGEDLYAKTPGFFFLSLARTILVTGREKIASIKSSVWWGVRTLFLHQHILTNRSLTLKTEIEKLLPIVQETVHNLNVPSLNAQFLIEAGHIHSYYLNVKQAQALWREAQSLTGFQCGLYGAMGVRTKYQTFLTPQLLLQASSRLSTDFPFPPSLPVPGSVSNQDEVMLDKPDVSGVLPSPISQTPHPYTFKEPEQDPFSYPTITRISDQSSSSSPSSISPSVSPSLSLSSSSSSSLSLKPSSLSSELSLKLHPIDQAILIALCIDIRNHNPKDNITEEEMMPFLTRLEEEKTHWQAHFAALFLRSRIELQGFRTKERAVLQYEALKDTYTRSEPSFAVRFNLLFCFPFETVHRVRAQVGEALMSVGSFASALLLFEDIENWEMIIACYQAMGRAGRAAEIVREQLSKKETPLLYCVLGDLTDDETQYEKAWDLSHHTYARAMRSIARKALRNQDWSKCAQCFELALSINPLYPDCWFSLGCAYMKLEDWNKASISFSRVVQQDPGNGESWTNLASVYIRMKRYREAYHALQEALKHLRNDWRVWENYLAVSMEIKAYQSALQSIDNLLELKDTKEVDTQVLGVLADVVTQDIETAGGVKGSSLKPAYEELLRKIAAKISSSASLWGVFAYYYQHCGNISQALEYREKQQRSLLVAGWEHTRELYEEVAQGTLDFVNLVLSHGNADQIFAAKSKVARILKQAEDSFSSTQSYAELSEALKKLKERDQ